MFLHDAVLSLAALFIEAAGAALGLGIVWYEGNLPEVQRTLSNRLIAANCVVLIVGNAFSLNAVATAGFLGGIGTGTADFFVTGFIVALFWYIMVVNVVVALKYVRTCHLRSSLSSLLDEDFFFRFIILTTFLLSSYFAVLMLCFDLHQNPSWYLMVHCSPPQPDIPQVARNMRILIGAFAATAAIHMVLHLKMALRKKNNAVESDDDEEEDKTLVTVGAYAAALAGILAVTVVVSRAYRAAVDVGCVPVPFLGLGLTNSVLNQAAYYAMNPDMSKKVIDALVGELRRLAF